MSPAPTRGAEAHAPPRYPYRRSAEQAQGTVRRHPVVVVGAGPVGLTAALDLAAQGLRVVVLDDNDTVSAGSRAICYAKRTLEIWDRLGVAGPLLDKGIRWQRGRVFFGDAEVFGFDLLPEPGHKMPAFVNLQQYHLEERLVAACDATPAIDLRWRHKVTGLAQGAGPARLTVETPDGSFAMDADWIVACDGAGSPLRTMAGARFEGQVFDDHFLIADIVMKAEFPTERWFWFDPGFHPGQSALLHKQPDGLWRLDFQLGRDADPELERAPERIVPRIRAMIGAEIAFEIAWASVYRFACRRVEAFRAGRVLFAGDAAHQVSPFGARGANSGVQDADNLCWKLAAVIRREAPEALIDSYHDERAVAADDNIRHSTRSTDFITPKGAASRRYRDAVLHLARAHAFARPLINSGRLSAPTPYPASPLNGPDEGGFRGGPAPGTVCADAPVRIGGAPGWLLDRLGGGFRLLDFGTAAAPVEAGPLRVAVLAAGRDFEDAEGLAAARYDAAGGALYLVRPDQHVAARWRGFDAGAVRAALLNATGARP